MTNSCEHVTPCTTCGNHLCQYCIEDCSGCGMEGCNGCYTSHLIKCESCPGDFCPKEMKDHKGKKLCPMCKIGEEIDFK